MLFTNAKVTDEVVYKIIDTLENNKRRSGRGAAGVAGVHRRQPLQEIRHSLSPRRLEIFQGQQASRRRLSSERICTQVTDAAERISAARARCALDRHFPGPADLRRRLGSRCSAPPVRAVFYTEQMLAVCLGLSLALSFISAKRQRAGSTGSAPSPRSASASTSPSVTSH